MENIRVLSENFQFLDVKFSIYLNSRVFESLPKTAHMVAMLSGKIILHFALHNEYTKHLEFYEPLFEISHTDELVKMTVAVKK